jgi:pyrroloquinoline quinone (PQQ) biosynthesis protein C
MTSSALRSEIHQESFWARLDLLCEDWDVRGHAFYVRSSDGLRRPEMQLYAEEYDHLVVALAQTAARGAGKAAGLLGDVLFEHARREAAQIDQWRDLARATGWSRESSWHYGADPLPGTVACGRMWAGQDTRHLALDLVSLYAIQGPDLPLGGERVALVRAGLPALLPDITVDALLTQAQCVLRAHWLMLDGLEEAR